MLKLHQIIDKSTIKLQMKSSRKKEALRELVSILDNSGVIPVIDNLFNDLVAREKITSTGIGSGVAIPHKLVPGISRSVIVLGRKSGGINFGSIDGKPVTLFFLIIGPAEQSTAHLRLLSRLSRLLHNQSFIDELNSADTPEKVIDAIKKQEDE